MSMVAPRKPYFHAYKKASIIIFSFFLWLTKASSTKHGFSVELIHRDSPKSPFYINNSSSLSPFLRVNNALARSLRRANHLLGPKAQVSITKDDEDAESEVFFRDGEFLMAYSLGTPMISTYGILDTGSNFIWTQCEPCVKCFEQILPKFDPKESSTYRTPNCITARCYNVRDAVDQYFCGPSSACNYKKSYANDFSTKGVVSYDTLSLAITDGTRASFPNTVFGCGNDNGGQKVSEVTSGIVGLGRGPLSLISQMGTPFKGKFSYCLIDPFFNEFASKLSFGQIADITGPGTVSTPILSPSHSQLYYLLLEGISVGDTRIDHFVAGNSSTSNIKEGMEQGNMIIDSGSTVTKLPESLYIPFEEQVAKVVDRTSKRFTNLKRNLRLCYLSESVDKVGAPTITVHFKGADLKLSAKNTFIQTDPNVVCLAFRPFSTTTGLGIYGFYAQVNFLVGYDLQNNLVSFKPEDCSLY